MRLKFIITTLCTLALWGCGSQKSGTEQTQYQAGGTAITRSELTGAVTRLADSYRDDWQTVKVPVNISLKKPISIGVSGNLIMERGKSIYLSIRKFGIEVGTLWVTRDSVFAREKMNHSYLAESLEGFSRQTGITLANLQSLLLGQAFSPGKNVLKGGDFTLATAGDPDLPRAYTLTAKGLKDDATATLIADDGTPPALLAMMVHAAGASIVSQWSDLQTGTPAGSIATASDWSATMGKTVVEFAMSLNGGKAQWDERQSIPTPSFKGYKRISGTAMLKQLGRL